MHKIPLNIHTQNESSLFFQKGEAGCLEDKNGSERYILLYFFCTFRILYTYMNILPIKL